MNFDNSGGEIYNQNLEQACQYVSSAWFPVSAGALSKVKKGLDAGIYDSNTPLLISDLKSDFSLFIYCIRELSALLQQEEAGGPFSPSLLFSDRNTSRLKSLLNIEATVISAHDFQKLRPHQAERIAYSMTSACVAETLAGEHKVCSDFAYTTALFRQLGLTLIAWNYPRIYGNIIESDLTEAGVDQALSRTLGFSPGLLGITLARRWGIKGPLLYALGDKAPEDPEDAKTGEVLEKICKVGETLARINSRKAYPKQEQDWSRAKNEILRYTGLQGLHTISEKITSALRHYNSAAPGLFLQTQPGLIQANRPEEKSLMLMNANIHVQSLDREMQNKMQELYRSIKPGSLTKEPIDLLTRRIIPEAGFVGGCIYMIDPAITSLIPRLAIGASQLHHFHSVNYLQKESETDPVVQAYWSRGPMIKELRAKSGMHISYMTATIGRVQKAGVIFLLPGNELRRDLSSRPLTLFHAISEAVTDCLGLT